MVVKVTIIVFIKQYIVIVPTTIPLKPPRQSKLRQGPVTISLFVAAQRDVLILACNFSPEMIFANYSDYYVAASTSMCVYQTSCEFIQ